jgi:hypothetical protein
MYEFWKKCFYFILGIGRIKVVIAINKFVAVINKMITEISDECDT